MLSDDGIELKVKRGCLLSEFSFGKQTSPFLTKNYSSISTRRKFLIRPNTGGVSMRMPI